jgi:hypothetical protein
MFSELRRLLPAPHSPIDTDESFLARNTRALGIRFPKDFIAYGKRYGSGTISVKAYSWEIYSPFRPSYPKFVKHFFARQDAYRKACETTDLSLGLFPEPGGLLPFGHRDDVYFTWKTEGESDHWTVTVLWVYNQGGFQAFDMGFSQFLVQLLTRRIRVAGFKSKWSPKTDITFESEVYGD